MKRPIYFDESNKKYSKKHFKDFLKEIAPLTIEEQKIAVVEKYNNLNLVDDFLLIGIKFGQETNKHT